MTFEEAKNVVIRFGEYQGATIDEIARTDDGLKRLDYYLGWDGLWAETKEAIQAFLSDSSIAKELERVLGGE